MRTQGRLSGRGSIGKKKSLDATEFSFTLLLLLLLFTEMKVFFICWPFFFFITGTPFDDGAAINEPILSLIYS